MPESIDFVTVLLRSAPVFRLPCCQIRAGEFNSLFIGFGEIIRYQPKYTLAAWSLGTYDRSWRIWNSGNLLYGGYDLDFVAALAIEPSELGPLKSISQPTHLDVRLQFESDYSIEFFCCNSEDDSFLIFTPDLNCMSLNSTHGWIFRDATRPDD